jgi:hypothetical protein
MPWSGIDPDASELDPATKVFTDSGCADAR